MKMVAPLRLVIITSLFLLLSACGGGGGSGNGTTTTSASYTVTARASTGGSVSPASAVVSSGASTSITLTPNAGYAISTVSGCGGSLSANVYTTGTVTADCTVSASFVPTLSVTSTQVTEGNSGTTNLVFTVTLGAPANGNVNVDYATSDGTATVGVDYTAASGTLTISAGMTSGTINVSVNGDTTPENDETLTLTLSNVSANAQLATASAIGTIINDDAWGALNDTGIATCSDGTSTTAICPQTNFPGQDADYGRDATVNDNTDGHAGFSFTKLAANGSPLAIQSGVWSASGSETNGTIWSCVQDNVTGLMWEMKTSDGGLHDWSYSYTWYNADATTNGGNAGQNIGANTADFVVAVNSATLCGHNDWRLPTLQELGTLTDFSRSSGIKAIDTNYFPNMAAVQYWTATPVALDATKAWYVSFDYGTRLYAAKTSGLSVRLVRGY